MMQKHIANRMTSDAAGDYSSSWRQGTMGHSTREVKQNWSHTHGLISLTIAKRNGGFYPCSPGGTTMCTNILGMAQQGRHTVRSYQPRGVHGRQKLLGKKRERGGVMESPAVPSLVQAGYTPLNLPPAVLEDRL